ncbi:hypothetical protein, partial [Pseudomonas alabamensis]
MTPQKLLTYLPRDLVEPITRDVAQATAWQMLGADKHVHEILTARVPAMQAPPDKTLSLASQLPPKSLQFVGISMAAQAVCGGLPAMQAAPDRALSLASQLPSRSLQLV